MELPNINTKIAETIHHTHANLAIAYKNGCKEKIEDYIKETYGHKSLDLFLKNTNMLEVLFKDKSFIQDVFAHLTAKHPFSLSSIDEQLEKDTDKWHKVHKDFVDAKKRADATSAAKVVPASGWFAIASKSVEEQIKQPEKKSATTVNCEQQIKHPEKKLPVVERLKRAQVDCYHYEGRQCSCEKFAIALTKGKVLKKEDCSHGNCKFLHQLSDTGGLILGKRGFTTIDRVKYKVWEFKYSGKWIACPVEDLKDDSEDLPRYRELTENYDIYEY